MGDGNCEHEGRVSISELAFLFLLFFFSKRKQNSTFVLEIM